MDGKGGEKHVCAQQKRRPAMHPNMARTLCIKGGSRVSLARRTLAGGYFQHGAIIKWAHFMHKRGQPYMAWLSSQGRTRAAIFG